jgi:hypothetical protein
MIATDPVPAIRLVGRQLIAGESGAVLATLGEDEHWRTPEGFDTDGLALPPMHVQAVVNDAARRERNHEIDDAWLRDALPVVYDLATTTVEFTADEVWARLPTEPREGRQMGSLMRLAHKRGIIAPTSRDRPSTRPQTHRAPIRIWRSCIATAPASLFDTAAGHSTARAA